MAQDCLFCKIIRREIPSNIVLETDNVLAFPDISPQAPTHILIIPKKHIPSLSQIQEEDRPILAEIHLRARELANRYHLDDGYRLVTNCGLLAGQTVKHLHFHLLGGRELQWPPG